jgi:hypothetical protein
MKDIDIRNIQPVVERRTPEKSGSVDKPAGEKFQKDLDTALASKSIEDRAKALEHEVNQTGNQIKHLSNGMHDLLSKIKQMRDSKTES